MPVARRNEMESLVKQFNDQSPVTGSTRLHQSRTRFLPIVFGPGGVASPKPGTQTAGLQDYYKLKAECLRSGKLFEDPEFPADSSSISYTGKSFSQFRWLRPKDIASGPVFVDNGYSRFDVNQGDLADCWLIAAASNLANDASLFNRVVPEDNSFTEGYAGIFHFRFWRFGHWYDVVIDDRLPTSIGELVYMRSTETNEFWSALLEKAYAKLFGTYEALRGGSACEAMEDFTGGVTEVYEMKKAPENLFQIIEKGLRNHAMFSCSLEPDPRVFEAETEQGLIRGHAYSITKAQMVDIATARVKGKIPLLRLRNPWGNAKEWNGPWSDKSPEWQLISEEVKREIGLTFEVDGEFWMSLQDFKTYFDRVDMCSLSPDCPIVQQESKYPWKQSSFEGAWVKGSTAGGCRNYIETFWHNPQYVINLEDPDEDDDDAKCTVIIALMQKNRRSKRNQGIDCLTIGFVIYRVQEGDLLQKPLSMKWFQNHASVERSTFINLREISYRYRLDPGMYVIVPSTFEANEEGEFLLRVFSECPSNMQENDNQFGVGQLDARINLKADPGRSAMEQLFLEVAGIDGEVDWMELKMVLDHCFRDDIAVAGQGITRTYQTGAVPLVASISDATQHGCSCFDVVLKMLRNMAGGDNRPTQQQTIDLKLDASLKNEKAPLLAAASADMGFSKDACRSMVAMLDEDQSGKLGFPEFQKLLTDIAHWKAVFKLYDEHHTGRLNPFELRNALQSAGYNLNSHILNALMHRYGSKEGEIWFDDFVTCAVKIRTMFEIFKKRDVSGRNVASFTLDDWIAKTIYS